MNNPDFRNTVYCEELINIDNNKNELKSIILRDHPRVKDFYKQVRSHDKYKKEFAKVYNYKCAYCGASLNFSALKLFEIDHYICQSTAANHNNFNKDDMCNLIFSCTMCNRKKSDFNFIDEQHMRLLYPDDKHYKEIFYRDKLYNLKISEKYKKDILINQFYNKLEFDNFVRRLDYLLLNIDGFIKNSKNEEINNVLNKVERILIKKKNCSY